MADAIDVAYEIIKKGKELGKDLTNLQVVKLCYICHGIYMALHKGEPLVDQPIEAWKYGPVIADVYRQFKEYGTDTIPFDNADAVESTLDEESIEVVLAVVKAYGGISGSELIDRTHGADSPWTPVWDNNGHRGNVGAEIPNDAIRKHFLKVLQSKGAHRSL